ncbi:MAG: vanillate/3-O-methylgallate O-demethylase, partial [Alphaproteobacteria bacterium]
MTARNLEDVLQSAGSIVEMLRNSQIGAYVYPVVPPEYTNWRDEQRAWRETAVLFDQSHHMAELMVEGPDAEAFLSGLAINSFANFPVGKAKHFVPCSHSGHVIGDVIIFRLDEARYNLVGRAPTVSWVEFNAQAGSHDVTLARDDRSPPRPGGKPVVRRHYRYQVQGPNASQILDKLNGGPVPDISFFNTDWITIAGRKVRALRHGMAGVPGLEVWGPYEEGDEIRAAIIEAGREYGMHQVGARAYATNTLESGWIPSPLPAVYTGDAMKAYRQWLPANSYEATGSIGGSYVSDNIGDYYLTPHELGYGIYIKFDHDFVGREALEAMKDQRHRKKVTFELNAEDVGKVHRSMLVPGGTNYKSIDLPLSNYASSSYDKVMIGDRIVGFSMFSGY